MEIKEKIEGRKVLNGYIISHRSGEVVADSRESVINELAKSVSVVIPEEIDNQISLTFILGK